MKRLLLLLTCGWLTLALSAQDVGDWRESLRQWMTAEELEEGYGEETLEMLSEWAQNPINLNQTSREQLEQLPFLTERQIEGIVEYLDRYHPIRSLSELMMITALDYDTRQLLQHFVYVGEEKAKRVWPQMSDIITDGKHTLTATAKIPFYRRQGDRHGYLGYPYRHDIRYQFNYRNRIKFGLTGAQDAGEPFFSHNNSTGYDHYSYYFQLRDMGRLESLNIGMYRVNMGMGLVMNNGFHLGKLSTLQSMGRSTRLLTAYTSRSSANYLQGAAATVRLGRSWRITAFASYRAVDATLTANDMVQTLRTDGYHRTPSEIEKKHNTRETDLGGSFGWQRGTAYVNVNTVFTHYNRSLEPRQTPAYRQYAASGNDFWNSSVDYGYRNAQWSMSGETAICRQGAVALIHTVSWQPSDQWSLMVLHRYYDKRYTAQHGQSFSEGSSVQNEHGIYAGASWQPSRAWTIQGYADYAHFPAPRYLVSAPSDAFDASAMIGYQRKRWTFNMRYRYHVRQQDDSNKQYLANKSQHRLRMSAVCNATPTLSLRSQCDAVISSFQGERSRGIMLGQQVQWQWRWLKANANVAWFHTDDYDSRLYQYESSVRYDFSFPPYYGHGIRYALMGTADMGHNLSLTLKAGVTNYFDRSTIGSGLQLIDHSSQSDLLVQLNVKI